MRKNKKELEFEQKLYKEKEEMLEKEKQLKINRLAQEVCVLLTGQVSIPGTQFGCSPPCSWGDQLELFSPSGVQGWSEPCSVGNVGSSHLPRVMETSFWLRCIFGTETRLLAQVWV